MVYIYLKDNFLDYINRLIIKPKFMTKKAKSAFIIFILFSSILSLTIPPITVATEWSNAKMHYPQLPDSTGYDLDFRNTGGDNCPLGDDWQCTETGNVTGIHFWISWHDDYDADIPYINVSIWSNGWYEAGGIFAPNVSLWSRTFNAETDFTVSEPMVGDQGWMEPDTSPPEEHDHIYYYQIDIENITNPFYQEQGNIYWLVIEMPDLRPHYVGWKSSDNHFMDAAVANINGGYQDWWDMWESEEQMLDLAFVITSELAGFEYKMHYPQFPDLYGWDVTWGTEGAYYLADDWMCTESGNVSEMYFWISTYGDNIGYAEIQSYLENDLDVCIYADTPAPPYSHPNMSYLLWATSGLSDPYGWTKTLTGPYYGDEGWLIPPDTYEEHNHQQYWRVDVSNFSENFYQEVGNIYWFFLNLPTTGLGWKTSQNHFMDNAVYLPTSGQEWHPLYGPINLSEPIDFAFVIGPMEQAEQVPTIITNNSIDIGETNATLCGYLYDDGGEPCNTSFKYGETTSYGNTIETGFDYNWSIVTNEGDGDVEGYSPMLGTSNNHGYISSSAEFHPELNFTISSVSVDLTTAGASYDLLVDVYIDNSPCDTSWTDGTKVKDDWSPSWSSGWQTITLDAPYEVIAGQTYEISFASQNLGSDNAYVFMYLDTSTNNTYYRWQHNEYYSATSYADIIFYGITYEQKLNSGEEFNATISSLDPGTLYHYRAVAENSNATSYGSDIVFLTKPFEPTNLTATSYNLSQINLTWTKGNGTNYTYIERNTISSWNLGSGVEIYNGTGTNYEDNISAGIYYYQAWSYAEWDDLHQWSDEYDTAFLIAFENPAVTTNPATNVEETTATLNGYLDDDGGETNNPVGFEITSSNETENITMNTNVNTGESFSYNLDKHNTFGQTGALAATYPADNKILGSQYLCPDNSTASSITVHLKNSESSDTTFQYKCALYRYGGDWSLVGTTEERTITLLASHGSDGWYTFNITGTVNLYANTLYVICGYGSAGTEVMSEGGWTKNQLIYNPYSYDDWPNPLTLSANHSGYDMAIYCSYTISNTLQELNPGVLYTYRAWANNSLGRSYGSEETFLTKPNATTSLVATAYSLTQINLAWTQGTGATRTIIERNASSETVWSRSEGIQIYNDTGTSYSDTGLTDAVTYYYQAWSYCNGSGLYQYSDGFDSTYNTTISPPTVTTNDATNIGTTTATLNGNLIDDAGEACTVWFEYGKTTSYGYKTSNQSKQTGEEFNEGITSLDPGTLYHYRAVANNVNSTSYGSDKYFLTKPVPPSLSVTILSNSSLNISWVKGTGANSTYVEGNASGQTVWDLGEGIPIYNGSGTYFEDTGLGRATTYYYQAWSYAEWTVNPTLHQWSEYDSDYGYTEADAPIVTTNISTSVEESTATLYGYLNYAGDEACNVRFEYGTNTSYGYVTDNQSKTAGEEFNEGITSLDPGTLYHYRAVAENSNAASYGSDIVFLTKPFEPTNLTATAYSLSQINLTWTKGNGTNNTYIIRKTTAYPSNRSDGSIIYNGTGTSYSDTSLSASTTYYYRLWSYSEWNSLNQWSNDYEDISTTTESNGGGGTPSNPPLPPPPLTAKEQVENLFDITLVKDFYATDEDGDGIFDSFNDPNGILEDLHFVNITGNASFLISVYGNEDLLFIWDTESNDIIEVDHTAGIVNNTVFENNTRTMIVTVNVNKTGWIYLEIEGDYKNYQDLIVETSDERIIAENMIWRENKRIIVLDDPSLGYIFTFTKKLKNFLFDVRLELTSDSLFIGESINALITLINVGDLGLVNATLNYTLYKDDNIIWCEEENLSISGQLAFNKTISTLGLSTGEYTLEVVHYYGDNQNASAHATFAIKSQENAIKKDDQLWTYVILILVIIALILFLFWYVKIRGSKSKVENFEKIEKDEK